WPGATYGRPIVKEEPASLAAAFALGDGITAVFSLYQAIVSIITPIVTTPAAALDAKRRADAVAAFLVNYRSTILNAAHDLASTATQLGTTTRLQAVGQFAEKMSSIRSANIDLSKIASCHPGLQNPTLRKDDIKDAKGQMQTYYIPTDAFVTCYAQA